jgi:hypothetical protein
MVLLARTSFLIILISENIQIVHNRDILVLFTVVVIRLYVLSTCNSLNFFLSVLSLTGSWQDELLACVM